MSDCSGKAELLAGINRGAPGAWEEVVRCYGPMVRARARSFRMQDADVHDAVQNTWLRLAQKGHTIRTAEALGTWLRTTVERECLGILRHAGPVATEPGDEPADPHPGPEQRAVTGETVIAVRGAVGDLPGRQRHLLEMFLEDEPRPYAEIAGRLGMPIGSIGPTRQRAMRVLRHRLGARGLVPVS
jgi:RNA polymerase sigma factor (sigma-70 family)